MGQSYLQLRRRALNAQALTADTQPTVAGPKRKPKFVEQIALAPFLKQRFGIDKPNEVFLGMGGQGAAFALPDGTVLKVTTDEAEARCAVALVAKQQKQLKPAHPSLPVVYAADIFPSDVKVSMAGWFNNEKKDDRAAGFYVREPLDDLYPALNPSLIEDQDRKPWLVEPGELEERDKELEAFVDFHNGEMNTTRIQIRKQLGLLLRDANYSQNWGYRPGDPAKTPVYRDIDCEADKTERRQARQQTNAGQQPTVGGHLRHEPERYTFDLSLFKEIVRRLSEGEPNPYLSVMCPVAAALPNGIGTPDFRLRPQSVTTIAFAIPNEMALNALKKLSPLIDYHAGRGYWARLLRDRQARVIALEPTLQDSTPLQSVPQGKYTYTELDTKTSLHQALTANPSATLLLSWPTTGIFTSYAASALTAYRSLPHVGPRRVAYIGEPPGGVTGGASLHLELVQYFKLEEFVVIPQWPSFHDRLEIWVERTKPLSTMDAVNILMKETKSFESELIKLYGRQPARLAHNTKGKREKNKQTEVAGPDYAAIQRALQPQRLVLSHEAIDELERRCANIPADKDRNWNPPVNLDSRESRVYLRRLIARIPRSLWRVLYGVAGAMCLPLARQAWHALVAADRELPHEDEDYLVLTPTWAEGVEALAQQVLKVCTIWPPLVSTSDRALSAHTLENLHDRISTYEESFEEVQHLELGSTHRAFVTAELGTRLYRAIAELLAFAAATPGSNNPLIDRLAGEHGSSDPSWPIAVAYRLMENNETPGALMREDEAARSFLTRWWRVCRCVLAFHQFKGQEVSGVNG